MARRNVLTKEQPGLYKKCRPVTEFNPRLHQLLDDMADTLAVENGVGLAAPQVGVLRRAVIVLETNVPEGEDEYLIELINPEIIESSGEQFGADGVEIDAHMLCAEDHLPYQGGQYSNEEFEQFGAEGCLSVPGEYGLVRRPMDVKVRAQDRYGEWFEVEGTGLTARCFCHELDHLDGIVFTSKCERMLTQEELEAAELEE